MRVFLFQKIGSLKVEKTKKTFMLWETFEGYHNMDDQGVLKDEDNNFDDKITFYDGIISPMGVKESDQKINEITSLIEMLKIHRGGLRISKMFGRFMEGVWKYIGLIVLLILILLAVYFSLNPGAKIDDMIPIHR